MRNRSVPADILLPHVTVRNLPAAIDWFCNVFGFREHYRYGDPASGAQIYLGNAYVMLNPAKPGWSTPAATGQATQMLTVFVDDVDAHYERARAAGAEIVEELHETVYGERQYGAMDPDGHKWLFSRHARDIDPRDWGARLAE